MGGCQTRRFDQRQRHRFGRSLWRSRPRRYDCHTRDRRITRGDQGERQTTFPRSKTMKAISRREAIEAMMSGGASLAVAGLVDVNATADEPPRRAFAGQHQPKPLPFDPAKLKGISEKLI